MKSKVIKRVLLSCDSERKILYGFVEDEFFIWIINKKFSIIFLSFPSFLISQIWGINEITNNLFFFLVSEKEIKIERRALLICDPKAKPFHGLVWMSFSFVLETKNCLLLSISLLSNQWNEGVSETLSNFISFCIFFLMVFICFSRGFILLGVIAMRGSSRFWKLIALNHMTSISVKTLWSSPQEIKRLLQQIAEGNYATIGLTLVIKIFWIAGQPNPQGNTILFLKFLVLVVAYKFLLVWFYKSY